jgi:hypothetical protein
MQTYKIAGEPKAVAGGDVALLVVASVPLVPLVCLSWELRAYYRVVTEHCWICRPGQHF